MSSALGASTVILLSVWVSMKVLFCESSLESFLSELIKVKRIIKITNIQIKIWMKQSITGENA